MFLAYLDTVFNGAVEGIEDEKYSINKNFPLCDLLSSLLKS